MHWAHYSACFGCIPEQFGCKGLTKSWEPDECDQQFGENDNADIEMSQTLRKEDNAGINKLSAITQGLRKIIEKVHISTYFKSAETELQIAESACCIDHADTGYSKQVH